MESSYFWLDIIVGLLAVIPFLAVFQLFRYHYRLTGSIRREIMLLVYVFVLVTILTAAELPALWSISFHFNLNLIPFQDLLLYPGEYMWNFLIFIPFGLLTPLLWPYFTDWKRTVLTGVLLSLFTELAQDFAYRAANIDDFIMNVLGVFLGFLLYLALRRTNPDTPRKFRKKRKKKSNQTLIQLEPILYLVLCLLSAMTLAPYLSNLIWDFIYEL